MQYVNKVISVGQETGLIDTDQEQLTAERLDSVIPSPYDSDTYRRHTIVVRSGPGLAIIHPCQADQGRGLVLEYRDDVARYFYNLDGRYHSQLRGGAKQVNSLSELESLLTEPLRWAGLQYLELRIPGAEALARFQEGRAITYNLTSADAVPNRLKIIKALTEGIKGGVECGAISQEQAAHLVSLVSVSNQEILATLANDQIGRQYLDQLSEMPVHIKLQPS